MLNLIRSLIAIALVAAAPAANAALKVLATTADWGSLATEVGGDKVNVYVATSALQDVHRVEAKPSLVARARSADLVIASGADLEIGWLPVLLQESGNARIQPGGAGYFEAAMQVQRLEVPSTVDRSMGDIHPLGNPHVQLDPGNIAVIARALTQKLAALDAPNATFYRERGDAFQKRWQDALARWQMRVAPLKGVKVVVIHRDQSYLLHWLGMVEEAAVEPKPGVPPSAGYLAQLVTKLTTSKPRMILRNAYNDSKAVSWLSQRIAVPIVVLPFSVGGSPAAKDLFGLFDDTIEKLLAVPVS